MPGEVSRVWRLCTRHCPLLQIGSQRCLMYPIAAEAVTGYIVDEAASSRA